MLNPGVTTAKRRARVRAPELTGRSWLNTGGRQIRLADLRGKITLLDFWTFCCINCLHVLDELRPLEAEFADVLVTIGVHSPKFAHEADPAALAAAVERYEVHHPVLDDPELVTWQAYAVKAWPTLVLVDPEGYVVHVAAGRGTPRRCGGCWPSWSPSTRPRARCTGETVRTCRRWSRRRRFGSPPRRS